MKKCSCKKPLKEGTLDNGQPNIIDYADKNPLLFSLQDKVISNDYPGKIITGNEPSRESPDRTPKHGPSAATGKYAVGANRSEPTLPTGAPLEFKKLSFNNEVNDITEQLRKGIKVEREHTDNDLIAAKIAMDHLKENPHYYDYLTTMEDQMKKDMQETVSIPGTLVMRKISLKEDHLPGGDEEELKEGVWNEQDHPRAPAGTSQGGQFVSKDGGYTPSSEPDYGIKDPQKDVKTMYPHELDKQIKYWEDFAKSEQNEEDKQLIQERLQQLKEEWNNRVDKGEIPGTKFDITKIEKPDDIGDLPEQTTNPYENLDKTKGYDAMVARKKQFEEFEADNGRYWELKDTIRARSERIEELEEYLKTGKDSWEHDITDATKKAYQDNLASLKTELPKNIAELKQLHNKLVSAGKLEYVEIQRLISQRQDYVDDLKRRKPGSMMYNKDMAQIIAYDRTIDLYRTGAKTGHFEKAWEAHIEQLRKERQKIQDELRKKREDKLAAAKAARAKQHDEIKQRFAALGMSTDSLYAKDLDEKLKPKPMDWSGDIIKQHKERTQQQKTWLQAEADRLTLKAWESMDQYEMTEFPSDLKSRIDDLQWKHDNLVDQDVAPGVFVYSDTNKVKTENHLKKLAVIPNITKQKIQHVEIYERQGEKFYAAGGKKVRAAGIWSANERDGPTVKLWHNSAKWDNLFGEKEAFGTTPDHEYAHATYDAVKSFIYKLDEHGENKNRSSPMFEQAKQAYNEFNKIAEETGLRNYAGELAVPGFASDSSYYKFKLHPYTDSYYQGSKPDGRRWTETHSKLREMEVTGELDKKLEDAEKALVDWNYYEGKWSVMTPQQKENAVNKMFMQHGIISPQNAKDVKNLIEAYKKLQEVAYKL